MSSENNVNLTEEQAANAAQSTPVPEEESQNSALGMESESTESEDMKEMAAAFEQLPDLYEESLKQYQEGEVVSGRIVAVDKDFVIVDIGYKCEGHIPIHEFIDPNGENTARVGDQVDVLLERRDDEEDVILLSKEKASKIKIWEDISSAYQQDGEIEGAVIAKVKGGLSVDLGGMTAFLPGSQVDLQPVRNIDSLIGQTFKFKILKYNKKRRNVVLSRRVIMEKERSEQKTATLTNLEEGKVVTGIVKNITDYGVFVDLGGIDGLLHVTDMSWGRIGHPSDVFHVGDPIEVKILSFDRDNEKVSLGLKQLTEDPWLVAAQRYPVGERVRGKVVSLTDYGAFV
jgi:small subunit ribosomal protein S1